MFKLKSLLIIGISALVAGGAAGFSSDLSARFISVASATAQATAVVSTAASVNRTQKSDRLATAKTGRGEARTISTVEVVGIRDAAIIYRDRDGRVLYQSDPLTNATLITKGVVLPEVTVREKANTAVRSVTPDVPVKAKPAEPTSSAPQSSGRRPRIPEGCDAAASPIAAPQLSHILSKCLV